MISIHNIFDVSLRENEALSISNFFFKWTIGLKPWFDQKISIIKRYQVLKKLKNIDFYAKTSLNPLTSMKKVIEPFDFNAKNFKRIEVKGFKSPQLSYLLFTLFRIISSNLSRCSPRLSACRFQFVVCSFLILLRVCLLLFLFYWSVCLSAHLFSTFRFLWSGFWSSFSPHIQLMNLRAKFKSIQFDIRGHQPKCQMS